MKRPWSEGMGEAKLKPSVHLEARAGPRPGSGSAGGTALLVPASHLCWLCLVAAALGLVTASPVLVSMRGEQQLGSLGGAGPGREPGAIN